MKTAESEAIPVGEVVATEPVPAVVPAQRVSATLSPAGTPISMTGTPPGAPDGGACNEPSPAPSLRPAQPISITL